MIHTQSRSDAIGQQKLS